MTWVCDRQIWRTRRGKLVESSDPRCTDGATLVADVGMIFPEKPTIEPNPNALKAIKPSEDKAVKPSRNKGREAKEDESLLPPPPMSDDIDEDGDSDEED